LGKSQAFDEHMVTSSMAGVTQCLQDAFNHKQERLQTKAAARSTWQRFTGYFTR
jgi:hypothetical protein